MLKSSRLYSSRKYSTEVIHQPFASSAAQEKSNAAKLMFLTTLMNEQSKKGTNTWRPLGLSTEAVKPTLLLKPEVDLYSLIITWSWNTLSSFQCRRLLLRDFFPDITEPDDDDEYKDWVVADETGEIWHEDERLEGNLIRGPSGSSGGIIAAMFPPLRYRAIWNKIVICSQDRTCWLFPRFSLCLVQRRHGMVRLIIQIGMDGPSGRPPCQSSNHKKYVWKSQVSMQVAWLQTYIHAAAATK